MDRKPVTAWVSFPDYEKLQFLTGSQLGDMLSNELHRSKLSRPRKRWRWQWPLVRR